MQKWIEFNIRHPKLVLAFLLVITLVSFKGLSKLYYDSSTDALMPKSEPVYQLGQRVKKVFGDSKTFLIVAVEAINGNTLFSPKVFSHINHVVEEIEEFRKFNFELENKRIEKIITLANVSKVPVTKKSKNTAKPFKNKGALEDTLDEEIFNESESDQDSDNKIKETERQSTEKQKEDDVWDLNKPLNYDFYTKAIRDRINYDYDNYTPVTINQLKQGLDELGRRQLLTILKNVKLDSLKHDTKLAIDEFVKILETWETVYLYKSMEIVKTFMNPITGEDIIGTVDELRPRELVLEDDNGKRLLPETEKDFIEYKKILLSNPAYKSTLYSLNDKGEFDALALSTVFKPQRDHVFITDYFLDLYNKYNKDPVEFTYGGIPMYQVYVKQYMQNDMKKLMPLVVLVLIVVFYLNFRLMRGVFIPIITVVTGMVLTMGLLGFFDVPITLIVNILPTLLIAVASSDSIHIFNQYLLDQKLINKEGKKAGLTLSMSHISLTVLLTSITTFIGFSTLSINQVTSLKHFGIFAAIGTIIAMAVTITLIPAALTLMKILPLKTKKSEKYSHAHANIVIQKIVNAFSHLSINYSKTICLILFVLILFFSYGLSKLSVETSPLYSFNEDSYVYQSDMKMNRLFEGTIALNLIIDSGKKNGIKDPEFLNFVEEIRKWLVTPEGKEKYHHLRTFAFTDIIKRMHKAINNEDPAYYKIPQNRTTIEEYIEIYAGEDRDSEGRIDSFEQFIDADYRELNITLRTGNYKDQVFTASIGNEGIKRIQKYMSEHPLGRKYTWRLTGEPFNFAILADLIIEGQIISIILTLMVIGVIMMFLFKNWKAGLVSIIPISASIIIVYGAMGYFGIPLDIAKCLLAAITIGIGIDDTVHMMKTLRYFLISGKNLREATIATFNEAGMAIVYTSLALIFSFSVFMFSEFKIVFYLGWLVAFTMLSTTIAALVLLPAVIHLFKIDLKNESNARILNLVDLAKLFNVEDNEVKGYE